MDDVTVLRAKAEKCRRLAQANSDPKTIQVLTAMAAELDTKVAAQTAVHDLGLPEPNPRAD